MAGSKRPADPSENKLNVASYGVGGIVHADHAEDFEDFFIVVGSFINK